MSFAAIERLLKENMGLDAQTVGASTVHRAAQRRMSATETEAVEDYLARLRQSRAELTALIEEVVVPETWFFRDQRPFQALKSFVQQEWLPANLGKPIRVLSIPCSTGEEPYSVAMALADLDLNAANSQIAGIDISNQNLARARAALYGNNSFRGRDLAFRDRYFVPEENRFRLRDEIRERVHFQQANLLSPGFLADKLPYDVIFCRNLLIYFDSETQSRALATLGRLLTPQGVLFLGHAESGLVPREWLTSTRYPQAFAFRRFDDDRRTDSQPRATNERRKARSLPRRPRPERPKPFAGLAPALSPSGSTPLAAQTSDDRLSRALTLANEGHLAEAAELCNQHLERQGPSAQALYLLGLVREATGQSDQAEAFWRKAIYLEPTHYEALSHLAALLERLGDGTAARRLRLRAERVQNRAHKRLGGVS
jgi:chemotaxis protein methyltransferase WspC